MPKAARHILASTGSAVALALLGSAALAQTAGVFAVERSNAGARILIDYDDRVADSRPTAEVSVEHTVLIARLSEPLDADVDGLVEQLGNLAARARLDPDGLTLRVALNRAADAHVSASYDQIAIDLVPVGAAAPAPVVSPREAQEREAARSAAERAALPPPPPPPADPLPVRYRTGQATEYTRIEFLWPRAVGYQLSQSGNVAEVRFDQPAEIDLSRLRGSPPRFLDSLSATREGDEWVLRLTVDPGVQVRAWDDGSRIVVDLPDPAFADAASLLAQLGGLTDEAPASEGAGPETTGPQGTGPQDTGSQDPGAAEATEIAEAPARSGPADLQPPTLETPETVVEAPAIDPVPAGGFVRANMSEFNGDLRVEFDWAASVGAAVFRRGEAIWIVFDAGATLDLRELDTTNRRHVRNFRAIEGEDWAAARIVVPDASQAEARSEGNRWTIIFSERIESPPRPIQVRRDARRARPGRILLDMAEPRAIRWIGDPVVGDQIGVITAAAPVQGVTARSEFVGGALLPSAQGAAVEMLADDIEIELIGSGAVIGRPGGLDLTPDGGAAGQPDDSVLANISSPALMYFDAWDGDGYFPEEWRARLRRAALELGDLAAAQDYLYRMATAEPDAHTQLQAQYIEARLAEAEGDTERAMAWFQTLSRSRDAPMEAQSLFDLYRLQLATGQISRDQAIENLENLRFRWRGDTIELETVRMLGELYVSSGQFARGLETMVTAQARFPNTEASRRIAEDMSTIFRRLFLEGEADRMDPVEAVAIFYQYQHLAPIGTDGDRMIRRLADRLIAFDLLDPASELLQHQVNSRLREPLARARVATDLAIVYLMDRRYEDALNTIRSTRVAGLPEAVVDERYLLEARALSELGRHDQALELISSDQSEAANRLRADVAWTRRDWPMAGRRLETLLGNRYASTQALDLSEQADVMRAAIAYSLARDTAGSARLGERYGPAMERTDQAAAFRLLTDSDLPQGNARFSDMASRIASIDTLEAFMEPFRDRFNNGGGPS